ncbi:hypothetical protein HK099_005125 [Clydaea vesicula]|uniref:LysM domain-containing protein n=1 Tax=Clydaea vesicula TaxID=447962 RepID=A0AAD5TZM9_9FUNG|nr:hypothetical protein HK099_005125 [Clydaea vesicula]
MSEVCLSTSLALLPNILSACAISEQDFDINVATLEKFCIPGSCNTEWAKYFDATRAACPNVSSAGQLTPETCCANKQACVDAVKAQTAPQPGGQPGTGLTDPVPTGVCKSHSVAQNETCFDIAKANNLTLPEFEGFNSDVSCGPTLQTGSIVCLSSGSKPSASPSATAIGATTSASATASAGSSATSSSASATATSTAASGDAKSSAKALNKSIFSLAVMVVFSLCIN